MPPTAPLPAALAADWLKAYAPPAGHYDELKAAHGATRPAWQQLASVLSQCPAEDLARRVENLERLIQENGITYNVYGDPANTARAWAMDLLPMVLDWREWQKIDEALRQRVQVLNLVLQDLYGAQTLLAQRILPPELVLGNPAFLRPCHGFVPPDGIYVHTYGADLARSPDGSWWVLSDRVDAPSGIGYALENRSLTTRIHSDWLRDLPVARLNGFIQTMRESFEKLVAPRSDNPRIVLLTPGPANETYFEHSYLARTQGFPLVEGGDLTVRGGRVHLKTLTGMKMVDLILRRVDSDFCDPLELRSDSLLGVPGLLQAARTGQVACANSLGAGLLESSGLSPFYPALCRYFLGEEMKMPSVATWWCGQPRELQYTLEHLDELIIQPAFPHAKRGYVIGKKLSVREREQWRERLKAEPQAWCARESVALATTPMLEQNRIAPRLFHLRTFLVAARGEYLAMPGGLTRIPADADDLSVTMQRGGRSKDTWVLLPPDKPQPADISMAPAMPIKLRRHSTDLPSRVADNLFWLGRYLERTEDQARLLRLLVSVLTEEGASTEPAEFLPFYQTLRPGEDAQLMAGGEPPRLKLAAMEASLRELLVDAAVPHSLFANVERLESIAYRVKDRLSSDTWTLLGRLRRLRGFMEKTDSPAETHRSLVNFVTQLAAISGLVMENMTRGHGWRLLDLGRRIERGVHTAILLQNALAGPRPPAPVLLQRLLACCDSQMTYRRRYLTNLQLVSVLDLLIFDESNPRALVYQLQATAEHVEVLPRAGREETTGAPERLALSLMNRARLGDVRLLVKEDYDGARPALAEFLGAMAQGLASLSETLGQVYFAHSVTGHST